jgi:propionyl-CoA carboxylase alpha chain
MNPIRKLLVANRGEIATRVMRTARSMDIATVAVFSDADAGAPFVRAADEAVALPGNTPAETYLRGEAIIEAALLTGADAIHPGYGFLSENAGFAEACAAAGLIFVGPSPRAIEAMGSKTAAKELMARAGVPVLPWVTIDDHDQIDDALTGRVRDTVGFPVMVKASYGGGGRGIRVVTDPAELLDAVTAARREATSAFGNGTVFLERYVQSPRHVEVQVLGDTHGTVVHLFERECSVQRRYQKIIEEAPSPAVDERLRAELGAAAVAAATAIGYVGAGTVEFVMEADGRFHFLEVNTRLQVEHPVTEMVTGLDLVRLQLLVAEGHPLPPEALEARIQGHAVEARLYAEDVDAGFLPSIGQVHRFALPELAGVRIDAGVADGSVISPHYDSMLAKVIAHAPTRDEAVRLLARALLDAQLHGPVTNRDLLVGILREPEFRAGRIDTGYLTRHDPAGLARSARGERLVTLHALAAALAAQARRRDQAPVLRTLPSGWRNVPNEPQRVTYSCDGHDVDVRYLLRGDQVQAWVDGTPITGLRLRSATDEEVDLDVDGIRRRLRVHQVGDHVFVDSALGASRLLSTPRFPPIASAQAAGSLLAPMPGTVVRVAVEQGQQVSAGAVVVVLEAMKMEHTVHAPHDGTVTEVTVTVGSTVDVGHMLAVVVVEA